MKKNNIFKKFVIKSNKKETINQNKEVSLDREEESIKYCILLLEQINEKLGVI